jgi:hypothetical protein
MSELAAIHQGATYGYQVDVTPDDLHSDVLTFRLGTTKAKAGASGTPDKIATGTWGAYGATTALHTVGTFYLTAVETALLTLGLYYFEIVSTNGSTVRHLGDGTVQVVL